MRSTDEQLREIMKRAERVTEKKASAKAMMYYTLSACACIVLMLVTVIHLPGISSAGSTDARGHYGSLLLNTSYMGYVVIGVLAFLLGISMTLLCTHIVKYRNKERNR